MNRKSPSLSSALLVILCLFLCAPTMSFASGSYGGRPPKPPSSSDRSLYTLGKSIFNGKVKLQEVGDKNDQHELLSDLQTKLPVKARSKVDLSQYSGKLTDRQIEGLRNYLSVRYKIK